MSLLLALFGALALFAATGTQAALFSLRRSDRAAAERRSDHGSRRLTELLARRTRAIAAIGALRAVGVTALATGIAMETPAQVRWIAVFATAGVILALDPVARRIAGGTALPWSLAVARLLVPGALPPPLPMRRFRTPAPAPDRGRAADLERIRELRAAFAGTSVDRALVPRTELASVALEAPWAALLAAAASGTLPAVAVHGERPDDILGVIPIAELLKHRHAPPGPRQLRALLRPARFVPASMPIGSALRAFPTERVVFAVDDHGTFVGAVPLDDVHQALGRDPTTEERIVEIAPGRLRIEGTVDVEALATDAGIALPEGEWNTVAGFVFAQLGRLPRAGDQVVAAGHRFVVARMEGRRIAELDVTRAEEP